jgi:hypothetical protein
MGKEGPSMIVTVTSSYWKADGCYDKLLCPILLSAQIDRQERACMISQTGVLADRRKSTQPSPVPPCRR